MNHANKTKLPKCSALFLFFSLVSTLIVQFSVQSVSADQKTIVVPDEYSTITEAVTNASPGDTVFVKNGVYHENVRIDKPLLVVGEDNEKTAVIGEGNVNDGNVFILAAKNVTVEGFTIKSADYSTPKQYANGVE